MSSNNERETELNDPNRYEVRDTTPLDVEILSAGSVVEVEVTDTVTGQSASASSIYGRDVAEEKAKDKIHGR